MHWLRPTAHCRWRMPAPPKRADAPITAADAALAEHVLREKFEEFRTRWKQQSYDICIDTAAALKRWDAMAAVHGNMGNRYARGNDAESLVLAAEQYIKAAEYCTRWSEPDAKLKEAHWKCCLAWTYLLRILRSMASVSLFVSLLVALSLSRPLSL
eukprot:COSAG03_NODE_7279_length_940_cov_1.041617_1_plen_155_part_10